MSPKSLWLNFWFIVILTLICLVIALPPAEPFTFTVKGKQISIPMGAPTGSVTIAGHTLKWPQFALKRVLDIQCGMRVTLQADMTALSPAQRSTALDEAHDVISRRVDGYGVSDATVQTVQLGRSYQIQAELPGVVDAQQALSLLGKTAQLDFRVESSEAAKKTATSAGQVASFDQFKSSGLTGKQLIQAQVEHDPKTNQPGIGLAFDQEGTQLFAELTKSHIGQPIGIFVDDVPIMIPTVNQPITNGQAQISGSFTEDQARQLAIQLNSGALPVPLKVVAQEVVGATLGQDTINQTVRAGMLGVALVMLFMLLNYGTRGVITIISLALYSIYTIALYKLFGITLSVPGIVGLLLSIGMAVDSTILIFERLKEELRLDRPYKVALQRGFDRAWNSIKDANAVTIIVSLILINPLNLSILNTSGAVRGFGVTLFLGVLVSLFTGVIVTRTLMRLFLQENKHV